MANREIAAEIQAALNYKPTCDECGITLPSHTLSCSRLPRETTAAGILARAAKTYEERNGKYGNNWAVMGDLFALLYPNGVSLRSPEEFAQFHLFGWALGKLTRFVNSGDRDSLHDMIVYLAMVESIIANREREQHEQG